MELKDIKQGGIYFTRVSHIRAFRTHFPEVDSSKIVSFEVIKKPVTDTSELLIEVKPFNGEEHLNPRTRNGYWYIEAFNFNYIYLDTQDLAAGDCPNFKHFITFKYLDPELPQDEYCVQVDIADHFKFVKGDIILISSQSTDFRFVRVVRRQSLVNAPYGVKPSYNHILSNVEIAKIFKAKKINKYMFNKCEAIRRAYEDGVLAGEIRERESASAHFNTDEPDLSFLIQKVTKLSDKVNLGVDTIKRLTELEKENAELKDVLIKTTLELNKYKK